ncbi:HK97 family phage prohead protease [Clostridium senegalense]|uniref:HK97 family phage prohead protease n=1 Tax=Clostridium senegalense TaxID=1465809 RepID=UPI000289CE8C|nr:HK97 family phage prohead protease [Clostridium senegalense]
MGKEVKREVRNNYCHLEVRSKEENSEQKTIEGYVAKYNAESQILRDWWGDEFVEVIADGAFDNAIRNNTIKALYNHNTDYVLGSTKSQTLRLESDNIGLRFEIDLPNTQVGNDLYESVKRGDIDGNSFGFRVLNDKWSEIEKYGKKIMKRTLLEVELFEISPTPFPAYEDTEVDCRSLEKFKMKTGSSEEEKKKIEVY